MQVISQLVKYHFRQYFKTNKFVMPFTALIIVLYTLYSSKPVGVVPSMVSCCIAVFLISSWTGVTVCSLEDPVSEQVIILRIKSHRKYYLSHTLFLLSLSTLAALISVSVPVLLNIINKGELFERTLMVSDILCGFLLLTLSAFMGCCLGETAHPRIIKDRKAAVLLVFLIDIISMIKTSLLAGFPMSKIILWAFPPITRLPLAFSQDSYFSVQKVLSSAAVLLLYAVILAAVKILYLARQKF